MSRIPLTTASCFPFPYARFNGMGYFVAEK